jgi:hypothetical protein
VAYLLEPVVLQTAGISCLVMVCASMALAGIATAIMLMRKQGMWRSILFGSNTVFLPLLLPGFFCAATITASMATNMFMTESAVTTGRVVSLAENNSSEGGITYSAVVEFTPPGGTPITFDDSSQSCAPPCHQVGEQVEVRYRISDPQMAIINAPTLIWIWAGVLGLLTLVFFAIALGLGWSSFRSTQKGGFRTTAGDFIEENL